MKISLLMYGIVYNIHDDGIILYMMVWTDYTYHCFKNQCLDTNSNTCSLTLTPGLLLVHDQIISNHCTSTAKLIVMSNNWDIISMDIIFNENMDIFLMNFLICVCTHCVCTHCLFTHCVCTHCVCTHYVCARCVCTHCVCDHCLCTHCVCTHCACVYTHCVYTRSVYTGSVYRHFVYFLTVYFLELFLRSMLKIFIWLNQDFYRILKCIICCPFIKHFLLNIIMSYNHKIINYHQLNYWFHFSLKYTTVLYHHG